MFKSYFFTLLALCLIQYGKAIEEGNGIGTTPLNGHRGEGYTIVDVGSITHCGVDTKQQCFQVNPLENTSITAPPKNVPVESSGTIPGSGSNFEPVNISCSPDGLCVTPFDFDQKGKYAEFVVNCLNYAGQEQGSYVHVILGQGSVSSQSSAYSYFVAAGLDVKAKWESDTDYSSNVSAVNKTFEGINSDILLVLVP